MTAHAHDVTLAWDPNDPTPDGYRIFQRLQGQAYDYDWPIWAGTETTTDVNDLADNTTYCFVARAFVGDDESGDSNEVCVNSNNSNDNNDNNDITTSSNSGGGGGGCFLGAIID
ncbi:MAG: fibronectin type III domain-containing protein [Desulfobulbaceae bacterium]|nr:fibronectin type III domain-containing protein [Desulfobulbaceae bacterium]